MLESGILDSFMGKPTCTTFSPAQHPAIRSYDQPRGFDPTDERTHLGTTLALRALTLMWKASQIHAPGLLEQPRKTKMRRLSEWQFLVLQGLIEELITASCMFGSIQLKGLRVGQEELLQKVQPGSSSRPHCRHVDEALGN